MTKRARVVKIFCGSDPTNKALLNEFKTHMKLIAMSDQIELWFDNETPAGINWQQENEKHLKEADIVLLLVSPDFLVSHDQQIKRAMELHEESNISSVIPILIRASLWEHSPLGKLQPLPRNRRPIKQWEYRDEAFVHVIGEIKKVIDDLLSAPQQSSDMKDGFFFVGEFPASGYRWDTDLRPAPGLIPPIDLPDAPWLISQAVGIMELSQRYFIFDKPDVLREFAKLSPTASAVQQFANRYGYLAENDLVPLYYPDGKPDNRLWVGESLQFWTKTIRDVNILVTLWDMIKDRHIETLHKHIIWQLDPICVIFVWQYPDMPFPKKAVIASDKISPRVFYQWKWGEVIRPALHYLCAEVNKHTKGHINSTLFPSSETEMYMVPDGLRSALYVLLSMEVKGHTIEAE